jgi:hypothetical protein
MGRFLKLSSFVLSCFGVALLVVALLAVPGMAFADWSSCNTCCTGDCGSDSTCYNNCMAQCAVNMGVCAGDKCPGTTTCDNGCTQTICENGGCMGTGCNCSKANGCFPVCVCYPTRDGSACFCK